MLFKYLRADNNDYYLDKQSLFVYYHFYGVKPLVNAAFFAKWTE